MVVDAAAELPSTVQEGAVRFPWLPQTAAEPMSATHALELALGFGAPSAEDKEKATVFFQALQALQVLQAVNAAKMKMEGSSDRPRESERAGAFSQEECDTPLSASTTSPLCIQLPSAFSQRYHPSSSPPRITPPATPPSTTDLSAILAQIQANVDIPTTESLLSTPIRRPLSTMQLPIASTGLSPFLHTPDFLKFGTPKRRSTLDGQVEQQPPPASPIDFLSPDLKRRRVRVLQSSDRPAHTMKEEARTQDGAAALATSPVSSLASRLAEASPSPRVAGSSQEPRVRGKHAAPRRLSSLQERMQKFEDAEELPNSSSTGQTAGCWSEAEKRELVKLVRDLKPCGAADWELVASRLNESGCGQANRRGPSAERMYRTLTDPTYCRSANPHGRRLNPRKGSTPMHVMATYSLQKLPNNEGNLTQITELIAANERFAKELDWSPRPGTKTYPRWKDALVGCFKPGRYPHLVKTDKKVDGLTVYKLLKDKMTNPQRSLLETGPEKSD